MIMLLDCIWIIITVIGLFLIYCNKNVVGLILFFIGTSLQMLFYYHTNYLIDRLNNRMSDSKGEENSLEQEDEKELK